MYHYEFPEIIRISDVLPYIDSEEFYVSEVEGYNFVNYRFQTNHTFPKNDSLESRIRRECRGLVFDSDGNIVARRYHKFFNFKEREEMMQVDMTLPHIILEKLDGSIVSPVEMNGEIRWCSKMGLTDICRQVELWLVEEDLENYDRFAEYCVLKGLTPIFEFVSPDNRIVVPYDETRLVLTGMRWTVSGTYVDYNSMVLIGGTYHIDLVKEKTYGGLDMDEVAGIIAEEKDEEGVVLRFYDGHMVKVKSDQYLRTHKMISMLTERGVADLVVHGNSDDAKSILSEDYKVKIEKYEIAFNQDFLKLNDELIDVRDKILGESLDRKRFALEISPDLNPVKTSMVFEWWKKDFSKDDLATLVRNYVGKAVKTEKGWGRISTLFPSCRGIF